MKKLVIICAAVSALILVVSSPALATSVALMPITQNAAPGDTVTVSVDMSVSPSFTITAISAVILYDPDLFTYVDPVVQGAFLKDDWSGGFPMGAAATAGELRVAAIDWTNYSGEALAAGAGTLFTFTLKVNDNAPTGSSSLSFDPYVGGDNPNSGFVYGDESFFNVVLLDSEMSGASINVVPEPATICLLGLGALGLLRKSRA